MINPIEHDIVTLSQIADRLKKASHEELASNETLFAAAVSKLAARRTEWLIQWLKGQQNEN